MTLDDLRDGQEVPLRTGRYREGLSHPDWSAWRTATLSIQRGSTGDIVFLSIKGESWAEYCPAHEPPSFGVFETEGYYLQIEGLGKPFSSALELVEQTEALIEQASWHAPIAADGGNIEDNVTELIRRLRALDERHKESPYGNWCWACEEPWPCPDRAILDGRDK